MKEKFRERLPIIEWPELERRMAIMSRMTSDPPIESLQEETQDTLERVNLPPTYSKDSIEIK